MSRAILAGLVALLGLTTGAAFATNDFLAQQAAVQGASQLALFAEGGGGSTAPSGGGKMGSGSTQTGGTKSTSNSSSKSSDNNGSAPGGQNTKGSEGGRESGGVTGNGGGGGKMGPNSSQSGGVKSNTPSSNPGGGGDPTNTPDGKRTGSTPTGNTTDPRAEQQREQAEQRAVQRTQSYANDLQNYNRDRQSSPADIKAAKDAAEARLSTTRSISPSVPAKTPTTPTPSGSYFSDIPSYNPPTRREVGLADLNATLEANRQAIANAQKESADLQARLDAFNKANPDGLASQQPSSAVDPKTANAVSAANRAAAEKAAAEANAAEMGRLTQTLNQQTAQRAATQKAAEAAAADVAEKARLSQNLAQQRAAKVAAADKAYAESRSLAEIAGDMISGWRDSLFGGNETEVAESTPVENNVTEITKNPDLTTGQVVPSVSPAERALMNPPKNVTTITKTTVPNDVQALTEAPEVTKTEAEDLGPSCAECGPDIDANLAKEGVVRSDEFFGPKKTMTTPKNPAESAAVKTRVDGDFDREVAEAEAARAKTTISPAGGVVSPTQGTITGRSDVGYTTTGYADPNAPGRTPSVSRSVPGTQSAVDPKTANAQSAANRTAADASRAAEASRRQAESDARVAAERSAVNEASRVAEASRRQAESDARVAEARAAQAAVNEASRVAEASRRQAESDARIAQEKTAAQVAATKASQAAEAARRQAESDARIAEANVAKAAETKAKAAADEASRVAEASRRQAESDARIAQEKADERAAVQQRAIASAEGLKGFGNPEYKTNLGTAPNQSVKTADSGLVETAPGKGDLETEQSLAQKIGGWVKDVFTSTEPMPKPDQVVQKTTIAVKGTVTVNGVKVDVKAERNIETGELSTPVGGVVGDNTTVSVPDGIQTVKTEKGTVVDVSVKGGKVVGISGKEREAPSDVDPKTANAQSAENRTAAEKAAAEANAAELGRLTQNMNQQAQQRAVAEKAAADESSRVAEASRRQAESDARIAQERADEIASPQIPNGQFPQYQKPELPPGMAGTVDGGRRLPGQTTIGSPAPAKVDVDSQIADAVADAAEKARLNQNLEQQRAAKVAEINEKVAVADATLYRDYVAPVVKAVVSPFTKLASWWNAPAAPVDVGFAEYDALREAVNINPEGVADVIDADTPGIATKGPTVQSSLNLPDVPAGFSDDDIREAQKDIAVSTLGEGVTPQFDSLGRATTPKTPTTPKSITDKVPVDAPTTRSVANTPRVGQSIFESQNPADMAYTGRAPATENRELTLNDGTVAARMTFDAVNGRFSLNTTVDQPQTNIPDGVRSYAVDGVRLNMQYRGGTVVAMSQTALPGQVSVTPAADAEDEQQAFNDNVYDGLPVGVVPGEKVKQKPAPAPSIKPDEDEEIVVKIEKVPEDEKPAPKPPEKKKSVIDTIRDRLLGGNPPSNQPRNEGGGSDREKPWWVKEQARKAPVATTTEEVYDRSWIQALRARLGW